MNFLDPKDFPFLQTIKDNFYGIREEYRLNASIAFPWKEEQLYSKGWDVIGLRYEGMDIEEIKQKFPITTSVFFNLPVKIHTCGFSIMRPGCEIHPHTNDNHNVLRSHLCLTKNNDCGLIVNGETRIWEEGEFLVFDDTMLHSAYNRGTTDRVIVLFDFYKELPE